MIYLKTSVCFERRRNQMFSDKMSAMQSWQNLLKSGTCLTNVKIITKEGKEKLTHKLFLVSISEAYRTLLLDHTAVDDIVIIAPDDTLEDIEIELEQFLLASVSQYDDNKEAFENYLESTDNEKDLNKDCANVLDSGQSKNTNKDANIEDKECYLEKIDILDESVGYINKTKTRPALQRKRQNLTITGSKESKKEKYEAALEAYYRFEIIIVRKAIQII